MIVHSALIKTLGMTKCLLRAGPQARVEPWEDHARCLPSRNLEFHWDQLNMKERGMIKIRCGLNTHFKLGTVEFLLSPILIFKWLSYPRLWLWKKNPQEEINTTPKSPISGSSPIYFDFSSWGADLPLLVNSWISVVQSLFDKTCLITFEFA